VGVTDILGIGSKVDSDTELATLHASCESGWNEAAERILKAISFSTQKPSTNGVIYQRIAGN